MDTPAALCPDHYPNFQCIGSDCEDSCCIGWRVHLDKKTYRLYKQNHHKALKQLFEQAVKRADTKGDNQHFGVIEMGDDGRCAFLDNDNLCRIQRNLGADALSKVCTNYPRRANSVGRQLEYSLSLSCPEAARLALLNCQPMRFVEIQLDPSLDSLSSLGCTAQGNESHLRILNDLRALIIGILQARGLTIEGRLILTGLLLDDFEAASRHEEHQAPDLQTQALQRYIELLGQPEILQRDFDQIQPNIPLKMSLVTALIGSIPTSAHNNRFREKLQEAAHGLSFSEKSPSSDAERIALHAQAHSIFYAPFFAKNAHILENYLVHYVFHNLFPFARATLTAQYREMVCNYLAITTLLLGQAAHHKGMTEECAIGTIQSFTRFAGHYTHFKETIERILAEKNLSDTSTFFILLANFNNAPRCEPEAGANDKPAQQ